MEVNVKKIWLLASLMLLSACGGGGSSSTSNNDPTVGTLAVSFANGPAKTVELAPTSQKVKIVITNKTTGPFKGFKIMTTCNYPTPAGSSAWSPSVPLIDGYLVEAIGFILDGTHKRLTRYAVTTVNVKSSGGSATLSPTAISGTTMAFVPTQANYTSSFKVATHSQRPLTSQASVFTDTTKFSIYKAATFNNHSTFTIKPPAGITADKTPLYYQFVFFIDPFYLSGKDGTASSWIYTWPNPTASWGDSDLFTLLTFASNGLGINLGSGW